MPRFFPPSTLASGCLCISLGLLLFCSCHDSTLLSLSLATRSLLSPWALSSSSPSPLFSRLPLSLSLPGRRTPSIRFASTACASVSPPPPLASRTSCRTRSPSLSSPALASQPWRSAAAVAAIAFVSRAFSGRGCSHHLHLSPPGFFPATGLLSRPACNALREPRSRTPPPSLLELTEKGSELAPRLRARSLGSTCFRSVF